MNPQILRGVFSDDAFKRGGVFLCDPAERIIFIRPFVRLNHPVDAENILGLVSQTSCVTDDNGSLGDHSIAI